MVIVRCTGVCALVRWSACERATARSIDVAVANRCAAAMNASASCVLSVPSAWRSSAAIRASILSSLMRDPVPCLPCAARVGPSGVGPPLLANPHGATLKLLADKRVERIDELWRKWILLGVIGDVVGRIVTQHMADALELDHGQRGVREGVDERLDGLTRRLSVGI